MRQNRQSKILIFIRTFLGWIFIVPISCLVPKSKKIKIIYGSEDGRFLDNVKHFTLHVKEIEKDDSYIYLSSNPTICKLMEDAGLSTINSRSISAWWKMLRASYLIVDNYQWMENNRFQLMYRAKVVQIWHGVGVKKIQLNNKFFLGTKRVWLKKIILNFLGKLPTYYAVVSTSEYFTDQFFSPSFKSDFFIETGYPRNDIVVNPHKYRNEILNCDYKTIKFLKAVKNQGAKLILYAPTFRDSGGDALSDSVLQISELNKFGKENNIYFVFKMHPLPRYKLNLDETSNIVWYNNSSDIYPVMHMFDCMISDYSSIVFDYLLLGKTCVYFMYDREKYETKDRELHDYFENMIVGPIAKTQTDLFDLLTDIDELNDDWSEKREEITNLLYEHTDDDSSKRIYDFIENN